MTDYSVDEVRKAINGFAGYSYTHHGIGSELMDIAAAYADLLERIGKGDGAEPVATVVSGEWGNRVCWIANGKDTQPIGTKLFTHPQAQVASGEWYCQQCRRSVDPQDVTYEEHHEACGSPVSVLPTAEPAAQVECLKCHGTGDVHDSDGMYVGQCTDCPTAEPVAQEDASDVRQMAGYNVYQQTLMDRLVRRNPSPNAEPPSMPSGQTLLLNAGKPTAEPVAQS